MKNIPKKKAEPDFKKAKQKVGTKKIDTKATNVNIRTKRIRIQEQSILKEENDVVNYRNQSLNDLVGQFTHYNPNIRRDALLGIKDLFAQNSILYTTSLSVLITKSVPLLLDTDIGVRQALTNIYSIMLPNVPKHSLLSFSGIICVFINNGMTSINPSIRKSSLLLVQALIKVDPDLFKSSVVKIMTNMIKLTTNIKLSTAPRSGVLASGRAQVKTHSDEQRPVTELALETVRQFFDCCFSGSSIYGEIVVWSGCQESGDEAVPLSTTEVMCVPLQMNSYSSSSFLSAGDDAPSSQSTAITTTGDSSLEDAMQTLLGLLYSSLSEIVPHPADTTSVSSHINERNNDEHSFKSKIIGERELRQALMMEELVANALVVLEQHGVTLLREKSREEWCNLLRDMFPLRLPDTQRNESRLKLVLQQVNALTVLLICMLGDLSNSRLYRMIQTDLRKPVVLVESQRKQQFQSNDETTAWETLPETVILRLETLYRLCLYHEARKEKDETKNTLMMANAMWCDILDKGIAALSLPFIKFYMFVLNRHLQSSFQSCLVNIVSCLNSISYTPLKGSKANQLWNNGLRLVLSIIKSGSEVDTEFRRKFTDLFIIHDTEKSVFYSLPADLQSIVFAVITFCDEMREEIQKAIPEVKNIFRIDLVSKSVHVDNLC